MICFLNQNSGAFLVLFSLIVALSTVFYVLLTRKLVSETRKMREVQTEPNIFVNLHSKEEWISLIDLEIQNIGLGAAYNLNFELNPDFEYSKGLFLSELNFIKNGVNYLAPNQKIKHFLTSLVGKKELKETKIEFKVKYENITGKPYQREYTLDFSEFWGRRRVGEPPLKNVAKSLEKIEEYIRLISSGMKKIKVVTYTEKEIKDKTKKQLEQVKRIKKEMEKKKK